MRTGFTLVLSGIVLALLAGPSPATAQVNQPPVASFYAPTEGATINARFTVTWSGADYDGSIVQFQYALDPPDAFTPAEIADPENSPGVMIETIPGPAANQDTLRVSKDVMGELYSFDWVETPYMSQAFVFSTPDPDSIYIGTWQPDNTFSGEHVLYLRALDDEGAYSAADSVAFTAETRTPTSQITRPILGQDILTLGVTSLFEWTGTDPEAPSGKAVSYLYRLLRLDTLDPPISLVAVSSPKVLYTLGDPEWTPRDSLGMTFNLAAGGSYVFGVRAVDESGAEEPFLDWNRNAFKFQALSQGGYPALTIQEPTLGTFPSFTGPAGSPREADVPTDLVLDFSVSCDASAYGGICADWRWGVDIADLESDAGWSEWITNTSSLPPLSFPTAGTHVLYVQLRDDLGAVTLGGIAMTVIDAPMDRDILWVDDVRDATYPNDAQSTQFWQDRLDAYNAREVGMGNSPLQIDTFKVYGPGDVGQNEPKALPLSDLGRYKTVIWENNGEGFNGRSGLLLDTAVESVLGPYVGSGGQLWLGGRLNVAATLLDGVHGDFRYPLDLLGRPDNFMYRYMKVRSSKIDREAEDNKDSFYAAQPAPSSPYPPMDVDPNKLNQFQRLFGGVLNCEAIFGPIFSTPGFEGQLDTVYTYGAAGPLFYNPPRGSVFHNKPCGIRWSDPDPDPPQGKTQWFTFPLYYVYDGQAQETLNRSLDWFRGEPSVAVQLSAFTADWRDGTAVIHWEIASASDHSGFFVHREDAAGERVRLHETLLSGQSSYTFVDRSAPREGATYWLAEVSRTGVTTWIGPRTLTAFTTPRVLSLANAPNPFRASTEVRYTLPQRVPVVLAVYDVQGRRLATLVDQTEDAGEYTVTWDGRGDNGLPAASGLYFFRLLAGKEARVQKAMLSR